MRIMRIGTARPQALFTALVLSFAGAASGAFADAGGCELLGFPSDESASAAPSCQATPVVPVVLYAGGDTPTAPPAPPRGTYSTPAPAPYPPPHVHPAQPDREYRAGRGPRSAHTDTTIVVKPGMRLVLSNFGGSIAIRTWPKSAVRVMADHGRRDWVQIRQVEGALHVNSETAMGPAGSVAYDLTVPAWLPVSLSGIYNDVDADGLQGGIDVETVKGDIVVRRAGGVIGLRSVEGAVDLVGARGTITVSSVNEAVRVAQAFGTVAAEAVNGDIHLIDVDSKDVEATTVNGEVVYDGRILDGGNYRFTTHSGDIALGLAESANATVSVSTFSGDFESAFAIQPRRAGKGRRFTFALGNGSAKIDLESFQGSIELLRPGGRFLRERIDESWKDHEKEWSRAFGKDFKWELNGKSDPDPNPNPDGEDGDDGK